MLAGCASASRGDLAIELFKSGLMYADNGEYERALREYDRAIKTI